MILVVEDDHYTRETFSAILDHIKLDHAAVGSVPEALSFLESHCPSILLVDMLLGNLDAHPVVEYCKKKYPNCKTVLVTALQAAIAKELGMEMKVDNVLLKPFELDELEQLLKNLYH